MVEASIAGVRFVRTTTAPGAGAPGACGPPVCCPGCAGGSGGPPACCPGRGGGGGPPGGSWSGADRRSGSLGVATGDREGAVSVVVAGGTDGRLTTGGGFTTVRPVATVGRPLPAAVGDGLVLDVGAGFFLASSAAFCRRCCSAMVGGLVPVRLRSRLLTAKLVGLLGFLGMGPPVVGWRVSGRRRGR